MRGRGVGFWNQEGDESRRSQPDGSSAEKIPASVPKQAEKLCLSLAHFFERHILKGKPFFDGAYFWLNLRFGGCLRHVTFELGPF